MHIVKIAAILLLAAFACGPGRAGFCAEGNGEERVATGGRPFLPFYEQAGPFRKALAEASEVSGVSARITGLTLPHHMLAADLIAHGFALAQGQTYERIILLSPEHFKRGKTAFSVPGRDFATCLGPVPLDRAAAAALLEDGLVAESNLFSREHGVQALLPFIAHFFPGTAVLPVAISSYSRQGEWDRLAELLLPLLTPDTLLVQSTDFSHYLPLAEAARKDRESLRVIASGRPELVLELEQPGHLDSRAGQYLQMLLQKKAYNAKALVFANRNACEYLRSGDECPQSTTSYIAQVYSRERLPKISIYPAVFFGGDFFTGRNLREYVEDPVWSAETARQVLDLTGGEPLFLNFEGVLSPQCPEDAFARPGTERRQPGGAAANDSAKQPRGAGFSTRRAAPLLCMPEGPTLDLLRAMKVTAVSLANNHSRDFGVEGLEYSKKALERAGIAALNQGETRDFPLFSLIALTDLQNNMPRPLLKARDLDNIGAARQKPAGRNKERAGAARRLWPLIAMVHHGFEFRPAPDWRSRALARQLEARGADLFVGAHAHRDGALEADRRGVRAWSLGNFLFDQLRPEAGGALLEVTFFPQGTLWPRMIKLSNLYGRNMKGR